MTDITALILADHEWFREQFAKLDELQAQDAGQPRRTGAGLASARRQARRTRLRRREDFLPATAQARYRQSRGRDARCHR